jgi:hypothetical protein
VAGCSDCGKLGARPVHCPNTLVWSGAGARTPGTRNTGKIASRPCTCTLWTQACSSRLRAGVGPMAERGEAHSKRASNASDFLLVSRVRCLRCGERFVGAA